jgi:GTP-binding protein EngB required for normal cell division
VSGSIRGGSALRDYVAAKHEVAELVRDAVDTLRADRTDDGGGMNELLVKLAEDRFNLAVVGQFKRGKSSLMNAVIGRDLLPTGVLPLTSAITALCYGPREGVWLRRRDSVFEQEIRTDQLADFVTERGNPGNEKGLVEARVELPLGFLRRGLYFIDTPGVGSASRENTATAYRFLPEADAVIFVTSVDGPLGEDEEQFLRDIREHVSRLIVVVNKIDMVAVEEREEVLSYIGDRIAKTVGSDEVPIFSISARTALDARLRGDDASEPGSGLREFEAALSDFLANEQGRTFLLRILDRTIALLAPLVGSPPSTEGAAELAWLLERAVAVRNRLRGAGPMAVPGGEARSPADVTILEKAIRSPGNGRDPTARRRRTTTGCPICSAQSQAVFEFFAQWQQRLATDRRAQEAFAAAGGFCPAHTWQFQQIAAPQDLSAGYAPLLELVQQDVARARDEPPRAAVSRLRGHLQRGESCPACRILAETERTTTRDTLRRVESGGEHMAAVLSAGWCLAHLLAALATEPEADIARRLIEAQADQLLETLEDMRGYALKRAAVRKGLINSREADAWRRALVQLVGERTARGVVLGGDEASWTS